MKRQFLCYLLDNKNKWGIHFTESDNPSGELPISLPNPKENKFKENDKVYIYGKFGEYNGVIECIITDVMIYYYLDKPEDGWLKYYGCQWKGSGHTRQFILEKMISKNPNDWD